MTKGLTATSSPIAISSLIRATTSAANQFITKEIDLQLNPLDNEVFVVTGLKVDFIAQTPVPDPLVNVLSTNFQKCSLSKTALTAYRGIDSSTVVGASQIDVASQIAVGPPIALDTYTALESNSMDTPPANQDYLDIIATNNYHLNFEVSDGFQTGQLVGANVRLFGFRAKASSSQYAALVQSEMLSQ